MIAPLKRLYLSAHESANQQNRRNILDFVRRHGGALIDLGCDDGQWTMEVARAANATSVFGIEFVPEAAARARTLGVHVEAADLNDPLPLRSEAFDVVHSNQVIEHVNDVDQFVAEVRRILKPGGCAVVSTENGSSWHNVFAAAMGWQIFSLTNVSARAGALGNPLAVHRGAGAFAPTWRHKTIMNYRGLKELFEVHGFRDVAVKGAGYYPLPGAIARIDVRHSAFLTVKAIK